MNRRGFLKSLGVVAAATTVVKYVTPSIKAVQLTHTQYLQKLIDEAVDGVVSIPAGTYTIDGPLRITSRLVDFAHSEVVIAEGSEITMGGNSTWRNGTFRNGTFRAESSPAFVAKGSNVTMDEFAPTLMPETYSSIYTMRA